MQTSRQMHITWAFLWIIAEPQLSPPVLLKRWIGPPFWESTSLSLLITVLIASIKKRLHSMISKNLLILITRSKFSLIILIRETDFHRVLKILYNLKLILFWILISRIQMSMKFHKEKIFTKKIVKIKYLIILKWWRISLLILKTYLIWMKQKSKVNWVKLHKIYLIRIQLIYLRKIITSFSRQLILRCVK
jgi:hypothetical protein